MIAQKAQEIIRQEGLCNYNWFYEHSLRENEVIIYKEQEQWIVCTSDERASVVTQSYMYFTNEDEAIDNFIVRLRSLNRLLKRHILKNSCD